MSTQVKKNSPAKKASSNRQVSFPIVGIGASAGGLETLQLFFSRMPSEASIAFVIIQHLSPNFKSIMAATEIASIFMDTRLHIKRYTPSAARLIQLIPTDIGRPLSDLTTSFPGVDLAGHAIQVLDDLNTLETEILSADGVWHLLKVIPYRTSENVIAGVVVTLMNIHDVKRADKIRRLATILEDANDAITVRDFKGRIQTWNNGAERMYGWTGREAQKMTLKELVSKRGLKA